MKRPRTSRSIVTQFSDISMSPKRRELSASDSEDDCPPRRRFYRDDKYHDDSYGDYSRHVSSKANRSSSSCTRASCASSSLSSVSSSSSLSRESLNYYPSAEDNSLSPRRSRHQRDRGRSRARLRSADKYNKPICSRKNDRKHYVDSSPPPRHHSKPPRRSYPPPLELMPLDYWERTPGCREAKLDHMERMDHFCDDNREYLILQTTLWRRYVAMEPNMFPYDTPRGIEHWTLWCRDEMNHNEVCEFVEWWLAEHMPNVRRWNYDSNKGDRSINLFHVHVYIETTPYSYRCRDSNRDSKSEEIKDNSSHDIPVSGPNFSPLSIDDSVSNSEIIDELSPRSDSI